MKARHSSVSEPLEVALWPLVLFALGMAMLGFRSKQAGPSAPKSSSAASFATGASSVQAKSSPVRKSSSPGLDPLERLARRSSWVIVLGLLGLALLTFGSVASMGIEPTDGKLSVKLSVGGQQMTPANVTLDNVYPGWSGQLDIEVSNVGPDPGSLSFRPGLVGGDDGAVSSILVITITEGSTILFGPGTVDEWKVTSPVQLGTLGPGETRYFAMQFLAPIERNDLPEGVAMAFQFFIDLSGDGTVTPTPTRTGTPTSTPPATITPFVQTPTPTGTPHSQTPTPTGTPYSQTPTPTNTPELTPTPTQPVPTPTPTPEGFVAVLGLPKSGGITPIGFAFQLAGLGALLVVFGVAVRAFAKRQ